MDTLILKSNKTFKEKFNDFLISKQKTEEFYNSMFESTCPEEEYNERVMELKDEQEHLCLAIGYLKAKLPEKYDSGNSNTTDLYRSLHTQFEMSNSNIQKYELFNRLVEDFLTSSGKTVSSHEYHQSELEIYRDIKGLGKSNRFKGYLELCDEEDNIQSREDHSNETEMKKKQMFQVLDYLDKKLTEYNEGNETDTTNLKRSLQQLHEYNKSNELEIVSVDSLVQEFLLKKTERSSGYYLSAVEVYTGISQHLAGSRFYLALDRIKCFKREGYLWKNICWDNEVYQDRKRIAEDQEHDQEHLCSAIGYLKGKLLELHERDDSDTTNSDVSSHKQYDMGDSISEKDDLFERLVREFLTSSRKTDSTVEYHQLKTEIFRDIEGLGNSFWFARRKHIHITCAEIQSIKDSSNVIEKKKGEMREILGYFKDKFLKHPGFNESVIKKKFQEFKKMNEANELGIESVDDFVESFRALPGKADEIYKSAVEVYTDINKLVPGSTFYWDLKVRIDYSRWLAYLSKAFPEEFSEMYNDDEKLLCERIGDLDGNKLLQMAEKLLKLSNKNNDSYDFFEEAIKVYTELNGLVDCPPMDGICSEKIIHYHEKLLNLAIEESTGPNPFLMKHLINYQNALTAYSNCCELLDITSGVAREFLNVLSFDFIDKPIDKHDVQSEWASYIYERYKEPNIKILDKIDRLVDIRPSKTGDHYESEIKEDKQDRLMSILTGEGFACIDYDVKNSMKPEDSYHQYIFINQNHLQIRIKLYNEVKNKHPKFTIGFYEDDPIDRQKDGPKLNIMKVPRGKEFEEDFVCTNQGNEIIKYANGCLTPAFYADNSDVGWDLTRAISDTQIKEIYKKITGKIKSYKEKCVNIKKYLVDHKSQHFGDEVIGKILKNREFLHGKNLEKQSVKDQIKEVLESCKKNVVDEPGQSPDSTKQIERIISEIMVMEEDLVRDGNKILEDAKKYMVLEDGKKYKGNGVSFDVVSGSLKLQKTTLNEQDIKNQIENVLIESYKKVVMDPAHLSLNIDSDTMKEELDKIHEESECGNEENNKSSLTRFSMFKHKDPKPKVKSLHSDYEKIEVKTRYNGDETTTIYERNNKKLRDLTSQQGPKGMC